MPLAPLATVRPCYSVGMNRHETKQTLNAILETIGSRGLSGVVVPASSLLQALEQLDVFSEELTRQERQSLVSNLQRQGLIETTRNDGDLMIQPSVKGIHRLQRAQINALFIRPQQKWDGTWRMVSYDIPARYAKQRRLFTAELHRLGFTLLKDSTWFHPYPCFDALSELVAYCGLTNHVMVAEVARIDEHSLRKLYKAYPTLQT